MINKESIKGYVAGRITKPFLMGQVKTEGEVDTTMGEVVDKLLLWGVNTGFGAEYFFSKHFSIGGEFGFSVFLTSARNKSKTTIYNPNTGISQETTITREVQPNISSTYNALFVNYYF